jgi:hypothetical protein
VVIDYEAAYHELAEFVSDKTQHGREGLLTEMAQIVSRNRVEVGELPRVLRLYSVEVARAAATDIHPSEGGDLAAGLDSADDLPSRATIDRGGHDGHSASTGNGRTAVR